jgi:flagellar hook assembly protein FlgD
VTLGVYDAAGRLVARLAEKEKQPSGYHEVEWNGRDSSGKTVASGVYFCRLGAGKLTQTRKMTVLR